MFDNESLNYLHKKTTDFFNTIFNSHEMLSEYGLLDHPHKDYILKILWDFKTNPNTVIIKPFYELDYKPEGVTRSITLKRDSNGFILQYITNLNIEPTIIEPFRLVSILKELTEDESIRKSMYATKENENSHELN